MKKVVTYLTRDFKVAPQAQAYYLFVRWLDEKGQLVREGFGLAAEVEPRAATKAEGKTDRAAKFSDEQPRDERGQFASEGGGGIGTKPFEDPDTPEGRVHQERLQRIEHGRLKPETVKAEQRTYRVTPTEDSGKAFLLARTGGGGDKVWTVLGNKTLQESGMDEDGNPVTVDKVYVVADPGSGSIDYFPLSDITTYLRYGGDWQADIRSVSKSAGEATKAEGEERRDDRELDGS